MKRYIFIDYDNVVAIQTDGELPTIDVFNIYEAYDVVHTENPLPLCLPQRLSINELEVGDIITYKNKLLGRVL